MTYLALAAVDLPLLLRRQVEHRLAVRFVQAQLILQTHTARHTTCDVTHALTWLAQREHTEYRA